MRRFLLVLAILAFLPGCVLYSRFVEGAFSWLLLPTFWAGMSLVILLFLHCTEGFPGWKWMPWFVALPLLMRTGELVLSGSGYENFADTLHSMRYYPSCGVLLLLALQRWLKYDPRAERREMVRFNAKVELQKEI